MIQKATLVIAINNPSSRAHMVTALVLEPVDLEASFWAGELKVGAVYEVLLDDWHEELMGAKQAALESGETKPPPLDAVTVKEIVDKKFTINAQSQERFQVRLGLTRSIDFLYGSIRVIIETDGGASLRTEPLSIVVCHPEFKMKEDGA